LVYVEITTIWWIKPATLGIHLRQNYIRYWNWAYTDWKGIHS